MQFSRTVRGDALWGGAVVGGGRGEGGGIRHDGEAVAAGGGVRHDGFSQGSGYPQEGI